MVFEDERGDKGGADSGDGGNVDAAGRDTFGMWMHIMGFMIAA